MRANVYLRWYKTKKREKRYYLVVRETGRRDHHIQLGCISRKKAEERRVMVLHELLNGSYQRVSRVKLFFNEFCEKFLTEFAQGTRSQSTVRHYRERLKSFRKNFEGWRLDQIQREDVETFLSGLAVSGRTKNMNLSILRLVFRKGVDWRYLAGSPVEKIQRWREESKGSRPLTQQELGRVLDLAPPWEKSVIKVMVFTGMRPGEVSQLKLEDIDWVNKSLRVVSDKQRMTKTRKSRVIPMSPDLEKELRFLSRNWPNMYFGRFGKYENPTLPRTEEQKGYVFCHQDGRPVRSFRKSLKGLFKRAGIDGVTVHGLRKTFCSLLARQGVHPKAAQRLMGHSDISLTMNIYTEIQDDQLRNAVNSLPSIRDLQKEKFRVVEGEN